MRFTYNGTKYMITDDGNAGYRFTGRGVIVEDTFAAFRAWRQHDEDERVRDALWLEYYETHLEFLASTGRV